ncbi:hypothetical protein K501DRAFT_254234 [Backusella circina FSU 941]|nr:hypothetical protein K501DRAFT_254234 [Backusella circina FSU 941]
MIYAGQAVPSVSYVMSDASDNITRMYPQALLKQFTNLSVKPNWDQYDIDAQFNTEINWYFANNPNTIAKDQTDFLRTVLHELIHGLGFITSWSDELYTSFARLIDNLDHFITPALLAATSDNQVISDTDEPQPFWGFVEYPLDKLIYYYNNSNLQSFTSHTYELNKWGNSNALFNRTIDMANSWYSSSAINDAKTLYKIVTTGLDVLAVVNKEPTLWLETSLNPFSAGSSLCHVDLSQYINSTEYLMVYSANEGVSVDQLDQLYPQGPIGPKLLSVMAGLGYTINSKYTGNASIKIETHQPPINYWSPPNGLVQTSSNPSPSLTVNTDGPAHYPSSTTTSLTESNAPSSSSPCLILPFFRINIICIIFTIYYLN